MGLSCSRASALKVGDAISDKDCLTFTAIDGDATVKFSWSEANKVMCSIGDGDNWFNYDANKEIYLEKDESVKFKGSGVVTGMDTTKSPVEFPNGFRTSGANLSVSGNLNSLRLDDDLINFAGLEENCFAGMFFDCKNLINASKSILDAEILQSCCYEAMFCGCISLTEAPDLPATQLADFCYDGMFDGCINLEFSELMTDKYNKEWTIKTDDGKSGYKTMFNGCIVNWLKYAPENSTVTLYQKEKDNLMASNGLTGSYNNKSETLSATSEEQEASSLKEPSDDIDPKYDLNTKSVSSNQLANSQDYESKSSKSSKSLAASKNSDSVSSSSLTSNQSSYSGSSNAAKSSAIKTGELTLNSTLLELFLLMLLSFKRKKFEF